MDIMKYDLRRLKVEECWKRGRRERREGNVEDTLEGRTARPDLPALASSAKMQPADHMSMLVLYSLAPKRTSGGRYHRVTTSAE